MSSLSLPSVQDEPREDAAAAVQIPPRSAARGWRRGWVGMLQIAGILTLTALAVGFSQERSAVSKAAADVVSPPGQGAAAPVTVVNVLVPQPAAAAVIVNATGSVTVRNRVQLVPETTGRVVAIAPALRAGGSFSAGEELLRIDSSEFQLAVEQANADLAVARSRLRLAEAESEASRSNYALLHPGRPVPPLVAKQPQIDQRRAEIAAAQARLAMAELELSRTRFSLPFNGKITSSTAEVGQVLKDGQSFGEAFSLAALELTVPISQEDLARLSPVIGRVAVVRGDGVEQAAVVERVSAELDPRTRFARIFLRFAESAQMTPGTFVNVSLQGPEIANAFVLPGSAEQMNGTFWMVDNGALRRITPQAVGRSDEGLLVEAFDVGDGIVLGAVPGAREGLAVRAVAPDA